MLHSDYALNARFFIHAHNIPCANTSLPLSLRLCICKRGLVVTNLVVFLSHSFQSFLCLSPFCVPIKAIFVFLAYWLLALFIKRHMRLENTRLVQLCFQLAYFESSLFYSLERKYIQMLNFHCLSYFFLPMFLYMIFWSMLGFVLSF